MNKDNKPKSDLVKEMLLGQSSKPNTTKILLSNALEKREEKVESSEIEKSNTFKDVNKIEIKGKELKKRGRKAKLHPDDKRSVTVTFKTSPKRFKDIENVLMKINEEKNFGSIPIGISEFIETLVLTNPKFKEMLDKS